MERTLSKATAMRKPFLLAVGGTLLALLLLPEALRGSIPIEEAQREFQARHYFINGKYVPWPACMCGTPAPAFPTNQFYGDLDHNPVLASQLVQDLANHFLATPALYGAFLTTPDGTEGIDGESSIPRGYIADDFATSGTNFDLRQVTTNSYPQCFKVLKSYIKRLAAVSCDVSITNFDWRSVPLAWATQNCDHAISQVSSNWPNQIWEPFTGDELPGVRTDSWFRTGYTNSEGQPLTYYYARKETRRCRLIAQIQRQFPRLNKGELLVYLNVSPLEGGTDGTRPPVNPTDATFRFFESQEVGPAGDYMSSWIANDEPIISNGCLYGSSDEQPIPDPRSAQGWVFNSRFAALKPSFETNPDRIACGGAGCASCVSAGNGNIPGQVSTATASLALQISLGLDARGRPAGYFYLHADQFSATFFDPSSLAYSSIYGVGFAANDGVVTAANATAYVQTNAFGYTIYFTNNNVFLSSVTVASNSTPNQMVITEVLSSDGSPRVIKFNYTSLAANSWRWDMIEGEGLRVESRTTTWTSSTTRSDTIIIKADNQDAVAETVENYIQYPWGLTLVQRVEGTGSSARTTMWDYYTNETTDGGNYGQIKQITEPSGHWRKYQYDTVGQLTNTLTQFSNNSASNATPGENRETQVGYEDNGITTIEKLKGVEIARSCEIHSWDANAGIEKIQTIRYGGASGDLTNILWRATPKEDSNLAWDTYAELREDGVMSFYEYDGASTTIYAGDADLTWAEKIGWTAGGGPPAMNSGTKTTTTLNGWGLTASIQEKDIASNLTTRQDSYSYSEGDPLRRSYTVFHLGGTSETYTYSCCGLDSYMDRDGTSTYYFYDAAKRQTASRRADILTTNVLDAAGNVLRTLRFGGTNASPIVLSQHGYDLARRVIFETNALSGVTSHTEAFGSSGRTVSTTYPDNGNRIEIYNQDGSLQSVSGTATFPVHYSYGVGAGGSFTKETKDTATGSEWTTTYTDMLGRAYKTVYAGAGDSPFSIAYYNARGQLTNQVDPDGVSTIYTYNQIAQQASVILNSNRTGVIDWGGNDRITMTTNDVLQLSGVWGDAVIRRTRTYQWAEAGPVLANETWASVDGLRQASMAFGLTNQTQTVYPGSGNRYVINTAADGTSTTQVYLDGLLVSSTTENAGIGTPEHIRSSSSYEYDAHGRQKTVTDGRNGSTTYTYKSNSDLLESTTTPELITGQGGQTTIFHYNTMLQVTNVVQADGTSVFTEYYPAGLRKRTSGSRTYPVSYTYDGQGRVQTMTTWKNSSDSNTAAVTTWSYNINRGWLAGKTYNGGQSAGPIYSNTPAGRLAKRTWAGGIQTSYGYNNAGDLATVTYSAGATNLAYGYDRRGRLTSLKEGGTPITSRTYTDAGQLLSESWLSGPLSGLSVRHLYDDYLRLTNISISHDGSTVLSSAGYGYDAASRLFVASDGTNAATYSYESKSPLVSQVAFTHNASTSMTATREWDKLNRLRSVSSGAASFSYNYNEANQRTNALLADGSHWVYSYDSLGQVTSGKKYWSDGTLVAGQQFEYTFDEIGNRKTTATGGDALGSNLRTAHYTNNALNQITSRDVPGYLQVLGSANSNATVTLWSTAGQFPTPEGMLTRPIRHGNYFWSELTPNNTTGAVWLTITNLAVRAATTNTDYAATNIGHLFLPQTPEGFGYDLDGNLTNDGRWTFTWDAENRLTKIESRSDTPATSRKRLAFAYDAQWRRTQKIVYTNNAGNYVAQYTNRFVYDGWNLVAVLDGVNNLLQSYVWGADLSGTMQGAGGVGGLLSMTAHQGANAGTYFYAYDGNGNVVALVNAANGSVVARYEYSPFGEVIRATGPMGKANPFRFSTKYQDDETDLAYYGYRYYNASMGRWLSGDPIEEQGGLNVYAMLNNAPVDDYDFLGLEKVTLSYDFLEPTSFDPLQLFSQPSGISYVKTAQDISDDINKRINKFDETGKCGNCIKSIVISAHGGGPGILPLGDSQYDANRFGEMMQWRAYRAQCLAADDQEGLQRYAKFMRELESFDRVVALLSSIQHYRCKEGFQSTFVVCSASSSLLEAQLQKLLGSDADITLFNGGAGFLFGRPMDWAKKGSDLRKGQ
jgi:RHS repeat-associated protein